MKQSFLRKSSFLAFLRHVPENVTIFSVNVWREISLGNGYMRLRKNIVFFTFLSNVMLLSDRL